MVDASEEFSCPICLDTLKPPIRITNCGHNFCHECLKDLCSSSQRAKCPNCRKSLGVTKDQLNNLTRNYLLEDAIDKINRSSIDLLEQMKDAALTYMKSNLYDDALQIFRTIILKELGGSKVVSLLRMIRCQIELEQIHGSITTCDEVIEIINSRLDEVPTHYRSKCHEETELVVAQFIKLKKMDTAMLLLQSQFVLVKNSYKAETKLHKLKNLGFTMTKITKNNRPTCCYEFLEDILREMQNLHQIDSEVKTRAIVCFMKYYSCCSNNLHNYSKSINILNQAIFFMKSMFGDYASIYQLYGHCRYHLALALERTIKFDEAKEACDAAMGIYEQANDWETVQQKTECLARVSKAMIQINIKCETYNLFWKSQISTSAIENRKFNVFPQQPKRPKFPIATPLLSRSQSSKELRRSNSVEF